MGTWPVALTHLSAGAFGSADWQRCWALYQKKWNARAAAGALSH
jgi:hypothetical protein